MHHPTESREKLDILEHGAPVDGKPQITQDLQEDTIFCILLREPGPGLIVKDTLLR